MSRGVLFREPERSKFVRVIDTAGALVHGRHAAATRGVRNAIYVDTCVFSNLTAPAVDRVEAVASRGCLDRARLREVWESRE